MFRYRVTLEPIAADASAEPLTFEVENHDDIVAISRRLPSRFGMGVDETQALLIGFNLLGEVVLKHRKEEPFSQLRPALVEFGKTLKRGVAPASMERDDAEPSDASTGGKLSEDEGQSGLSRKR